MIAEIYHKMSCNLEDEITGNFFGNMRYLPFTKGLKTIFSTAIKSDDKCVNTIIADMNEDDFNFEFWKYSELGYGEIDCYLENSGVSIGIEVKYKSNLSGENQLEREAAMLNEWSKFGEKILLFVAMENDARNVYLRNKDKDCFKSVHLAYVTWQDILLCLDMIQTNDIYEERVVKDLKAYLQEKGFASFGGFGSAILPVDGGLFYEFG